MQSQDFFEFTLKNNKLINKNTSYQQKNLITLLINVNLWG